MIIKELKQASSYDSMIEIVCRFIEDRFDQSCRPEEPIDQAAIQMLNPLKDHNLEEWAALACLSLRQFERNFITRAGISPKLFIRIVRFEYAMKIKNDCPGKNWSEIAAECGYNPMYLSLICLYCGLAVFLGNWWTLIFLPLLIIVVQFYVIKKEEQYLQQAFGSNYDDYKRRVRRWI